MTDALSFFGSPEERTRAVESLKGLSGAARKILAECIEHQGIRRSRASAAAESLEEQGFVFIRETGSVYESAVEITPSLWGEEAMLELENEKLIA